MKISVGLFLVFVPMVVVGRILPPSLKALVESSVMKPASIGVFVVPLEGEEAVMAWRADKALIPASTMKVITTATALQVLGPEFAFETKIYLKGDDLVVEGGGDPILGATSLTGDFAVWARALKEAGVTEIAGDIIADASFFEEQRTPNAWPWGDVGNYYGAGPSGLNYHMNSFELTFLPKSPMKPGFPADLFKVWPEPPGVKIINHMKWGQKGSGDQGYVYGGPGAKVMTLRGTVPMGIFKIRGAMPDPPLMCVTFLKDFLETDGIAVKGEARVGQVEVEGLVPVFVQKSPSLAKIVKGTNHRSVNLYADSIFKALTPSGSTDASVGKVNEHWEKQGVDLTGFVMHDGSGLSPRGTVTARQLAMILKKVRGDETGEVFVKSLPVAGRSGTLAGFGKGMGIEGKVRAKSGTMTRVKAYAGYFHGKSGREYAFAILVNNAAAPSKAVMARFLERIVLDL